MSKASTLVLEVLIVIILISSVLLGQIGGFYDEVQGLDDNPNVTQSTVTIIGLVVLFGVLAIVLTIIKPAMAGLGRK